MEASGDLVLADNASITVRGVKGPNTTGDITLSAGGDAEIGKNVGFRYVPENEIPLDGANLTVKADRDVVFGDSSDKKAVEIVNGLVDISAKRDVHINRSIANKVENGEASISIEAGNDLTIAKNVVLKAGDYEVDPSFEVIPEFKGEGDIALKAGNQVTANEGSLITADGDLAIVAGSMELKGIVAVDGDLDFDATKSDIALNGAKVYGNGSADLTAAGEVSLIGVQKIGEDSQPLVDQDGNPIYDGAVLKTKGDIKLNANDVAITKNSAVGTDGNAFVVGKDGVTLDASTFTVAKQADVVSEQGDVALAHGAYLLVKGDVTGVDDPAAAALNIRANGDVSANGSMIEVGTIKYEIKDGKPVLYSTAEDLQTDGKNFTVLAGDDIKIDNSSIVGVSGKVDFKSFGDAGIVVNNVSKLVAGDAVKLAVENYDTWVRQFEGGEQVKVSDDLLVNPKFVGNGKGDVKVSNESQVATFGTLDVTSANNVKVLGGSSVKSSKDMTLEATAGDVIVGYYDPKAVEEHTYVKGDWDASSVRAGENDADGAKIAIKSGKSTEIVGYSDLLATGAIDIDAGTDIHVYDAATVWAKGKNVEDGDTVKFVAGNDIAVEGLVDLAKPEAATVRAGDFDIDGIISIVDGKVAVTAPTVTDSKNLSFVAKNGNVSVGDTAGVAASGDISVQAGADAIVWLFGAIAADKDLTVAAAKDIDVQFDSVAVANGASKFIAGNDFLVTEGSKVESKGDLTIWAKDVTIEKSSRLGTSGELQIGQIGAVDETTHMAKLDVKVASVLVDNNSVVESTGDATVNASGDVKVQNNSLWKTGLIDWDPSDPKVDPTIRNTANLTINAGGDVAVQNNAAMGASGTATVTASGDNGIAVQNSAYLVSKDAMSLTADKASKGSIVVDNNGNVLTYSTLNATAAKDITVTQNSSVKSSADMTLNATERVLVGKAGAAEDASVVMAGENAEGEEASITVDANSFQAWAQAKVYATKAISIDAANSLAVMGEADIWAKGNGVEAGKDTIYLNAGANVMVMGKGGLTSKDDLATATFAKVRAGDFESEGLVSIVDGEVVIQNPLTETTAARQMTIKAGTYMNINDTAAIAASGDLNVTAGTKETLETWEQTNILLANQAILASGGDLVIESKGNAGFTGSTEGYISADNDFAIFAQGALTMTAKSDITISKGSLVESAGDLTLTATAGKLAVSGSSRLGTSGALDATAGTDVLLSDNSTVESADEATVVAGKDVTVEKFSTWKTGVIDWQLTDPIAEPTRIGEAADLTVKAGGNVSVQNYAAMAATGEAAITSGGTIAVRDIAALGSAGDLTLNADKDIQATGNAYVVTEGALNAFAGAGGDAEADLVVSGSQMLAAGSMELLAMDDIAIKEGSTVGSDDLVGMMANGNVTVDDSVMTAAGTLAAWSIGDGEVAVQDSTVAAKDDIDVKTATGDITVKNSSVSTEGALSVAAVAGDVRVENADVAATGDAVLTAGKGEDADTAAKSVTIKGSSLETEGALNIAATGEVKAQGTQVDAETIVDSTIVAAGDTTIAAGEDVAFADVQLTTEGALAVTAETGDVTAEDAGLTATGDATITADRKVDLTFDATLTTEGALEVAATEVTAFQSTLDAAGDATVSAQTSVDLANVAVTTGGDLAIEATEGDVKVASESTVDVVGAAKVAAQGNVTVDVDGDFAAGNGAFVEVDAGGNVQVKAEGVAAVEIVEGVYGDGNLKLNEDNTIEGGDGIKLKVENQLGQDGSEASILNSPDTYLEFAAQEFDENGKVIPLQLGDDVRTLELVSADGIAVVTTSANNPYPEVRGNDAGTIVMIDGRAAGGDATAFTVIQGVEGFFVDFSENEKPGFTINASPVLMQDPTIIEPFDVGTLDDAAVQPQENAAAGKVASL